MPITPFIGVRISWLMVARNSDFARVASSAADTAASSATTRSFSASRIRSRRASERRRVRCRSTAISVADSSEKDQCVRGACARSGALVATIVQEASVVTMPIVNQRQERKSAPMPITISRTFVVWKSSPVTYMCTSELVSTTAPTTSPAGCASRRGSDVPNHAIAPRARADASATGTITSRAAPDSTATCPAAKRRKSTANPLATGRSASATMPSSVDWSIAVSGRGGIVPGTSARPSRG